jgi:heptaprenyl diphosphate synthase
MAAPGLGGMTWDDPSYEKQVRRGLADVERLLLDVVQSEYPFVTETSRHLLNAGGKRFRPLVVLLAAHVAQAAVAATTGGRPPAADDGAGVPPEVLQAAVAIELTHLSTLYHDDVMDEALRRRGAPSANARWDNTIAILTGDFLFARASEITADLGTEATRILARTIAVLCEGQIRETVGPADGQDPIEHHLRVLAEKTGSLIATSGRLGALLVGADTDTVDRLTAFADRIGVAFQISDDLLDITSSGDDSGKTPGTDLREGIRTLPVLYLLASPAADDDADAARLRELLLGGSPGLAAAEHAEALALLRRSPALERARGTLQTWADEARDLLAPLPACSGRAALEALCELVVTRTG